MLIGSNTINKLYVGASEATKAYIGANQVYPVGLPVVGDTPVAGVPVVAWYDASDASTISLGFGGVINQWRNKSLKPLQWNNHNLDKAGGGTGSTPIMGTNEILMQEGSFQSITDSGTFTNCFNIYIVGRGETTATGSHSYSRNSGPTQLAEGYGGSHKTNGGGNSVIGTDYGASPTNVLVNAMYTIGTINLREFGSDVGTKLTAQPAWDGVDNYIYFALGSGYISGQTRRDDVFSEVILTNDSTLANREKIEGYLAHKWGLEGSLPVAHPYKNSAP